jgi:integrase
LTVFKRFYRWCLRENLTSADPTLRMLSAKQALRVPKSMSEAQVEALLAAPAGDTDLGIRDRAMLELMYASGLRVSELVGLKLHHLGLSEGVLKVLGKGNKERLVPFGEVAREWLDRYLSQARGHLLHGTSTDAVFVTSRGALAGGPMTRTMFWYLVKKYALQAGIASPLSPHTLRHALAEGGFDYFQVLSPTCLPIRPLAEFEAHVAQSPAQALPPVRARPPERARPPARAQPPVRFRCPQASRALPPAPRGGPVAAATLQARPPHPKHSTPKRCVCIVPVF